MAYKLVNKYGQNYAGRTFKTKAAAQKFKKQLACATGSKLKGSRLVKTKKR